MPSRRRSAARRQDALPHASLQTVRSLSDFVVENAKSARAFLGAIGMPVRELNIDGDRREPRPPRSSPCARSARSGLLSEAGCPAIADPGAALVEAAHREGFRVVPLVGPSSIVLALMASGLEGQRFAFCGYLPREPPSARSRIKELEARSQREQETEIFIETPYRNDALLAALLESCSRRRGCASPPISRCRAKASRPRRSREWRRAKRHRQAPRGVPAASAMDPDDRVAQHASRPSVLAARRRSAARISRRCFRVCEKSTMSSALTTSRATDRGCRSRRRGRGRRSSGRSRSGR